MWPWESYSRVLFLGLQLAWMFMDAFFVLSGFLITSILLDSRNRPGYYKSFYVRRSLRILPIYYAALIFITAIAILHGHEAYRYMLLRWGSPWWFFVFLGNIPTAITGFEPLGAGGAFIPLWSLQVEEQFYLLFPLLIRKLPLQSIARVLLGLGCFSVVLRLIFYWLLPANQMVQYVLLPCHMEGLAIGAWIAIRFRQGPWPINRRRLVLATCASATITIGLAIWDGCFYSGPFNRTIGFLLSSITFGLIIFCLIQFRGSKQTAMLRNPVVTYFGKVSYAAYLLHWPLANALTLILTTLHLQMLDAGWSRLVLIYVLTFGVSALSRHFFETPIMRLRERMQPAQAVTP
jgi:peptidoglycan/LPS O-acetylase OafA/YrhL